jgi:hypothetical protein
MRLHHDSTRTIVSILLHAFAIAALAGCLLLAVIGKTATEVAHWRAGGSVSTISFLSSGADLLLAVGLFTLRERRWFLVVLCSYFSAVVIYRTWWYFTNSVAQRCGCFGDALSVAQEYAVAGVALASLALVVAFQGQQSK